jgi:hypothetical protein
VTALSSNELRKLRNKKILENKKKVLTKESGNVKINIENKKGENKNDKNS